MGKQRTPQGQRPGRRGFVQRGPALASTVAAPLASTVAAPAEETAVAETPIETATLEAGPAPEASDLAAPETLQETPRETLQESAPETAESKAAESEMGEPASGPSEDEDEPAPALDAAGEAETGAEPAATVQAAADAVETPAEAPVEAAAAPARALAEAALPILPAPLPAAPRARLRFTFVPVRVDIEGIGTVLANYVHNESVAALGYMRALTAARSPADMIRLNVTAMQRAADASLTCWSDIARCASRPAAQ